MANTDPYRALTLFPHSFSTYSKVLGFLLDVFWQSQSFIHQFISPANNSATVLPSMLLPCGMLYLTIFEQHPLLPRLEIGSKRTSTTRRSLRSLLPYVPLSSVVRDLCYVPGHEY